MKYLYRTSDGEICTLDAPINGVPTVYEFSEGGEVLGHYHLDEPGIDQSQVSALTETCLVDLRK
jgi:hypothetical protein